jgi:putative redox protein
MTKINILYLGNLHTECINESGIKLHTDAPKESGGKGVEFSPTDLVATGLGSCMITLMGMAAQKLGIELKGLKVEVEKEMSSTAPRRIIRIKIRMRSSFSPNSLQREKLEKAALDCPVHHSLHPEIKLEIDFVWGLDHLS